MRLFIKKIWAIFFNHNIEESDYSKITNDKLKDIGDRLKDIEDRLKTLDKGLLIVVSEQKEQYKLIKRITQLLARTVDRL